MLKYSGMKYYLLEMAFYGAGVSLYAVRLHTQRVFHALRNKDSDQHLQFRIPERLAPGKFDIWGSSHQFFHIAVLCGMYTHVTALLQGFTTCHTLNVCQLQGVH